VTSKILKATGPEQESDLVDEVVTRLRKKTRDNTTLTLAQEPYIRFREICKKHKLGSASDVIDEFIAVLLERLDDGEGDGSAND
jgi:hypothetical protein